MEGQFMGDKMNNTWNSSRVWQVFMVLPCFPCEMMRTAGLLENRRPCFTRNFRRPFGPRGHLQQRPAGVDVARSTRHHQRSQALTWDGAWNPDAKMESQMINNSMTCLISVGFYIHSINKYTPPSTMFMNSIKNNHYSIMSWSQHHKQPSNNISSYM